MILFKIFSIRIACFILAFIPTATAQNIKSIQLRPLQKNVYTSIVPLGTVLKLSFDDLDADSKSYQYKIEHKTHDWKSSNLLSSQYINGFNQNTIIDFKNSFNTLQSYTHYSVQIPNINTEITKSGNYLISVLNSQGEVVFTRRFVLYENIAKVSVSVTRSRNSRTIKTQQTVEFKINHENIRINNPQQEINTIIIKNNNWNKKITGLQPTFFKRNQLIYSYNNKTNFWGGNEYLNFDSKVIRNASLNVVKIERKEIFHNYLYPYTYNPNKKYKYNPDINGQFLIKTIESSYTDTEADYSVVHFSMLTDKPFANKDVYIYGAFNDFQITEENKMAYDHEQKAYLCSIVLKQGFYNYTFATVSKYASDKENSVNTNEINGTFFETENEYTVLVYYKPLGGFYERVIGIGTGYFNQNK